MSPGPNQVGSEELCGKILSGDLSVGDAATHIQKQDKATGLAVSVSATLTRKGHPGRAVEFVRALDPVLRNIDTIRLTLCNALVKQKSYDAALVELETAPAEAELKRQFINFRAKILSLQGKHTDVMEIFNYCTPEQRDDELFWLVADALVALGRSHELASLLETAPPNRKAKIAKIMRRAGQKDEKTPPTPRPAPGKKQPRAFVLPDIPYPTCKNYEGYLGSLCPSGDTKNIQSLIERLNPSEQFAFCMIAVRTFIRLGKKDCAWTLLLNQPREGWDFSKYMTALGIMRRGGHPDTNEDISFYSTLLKNSKKPHAFNFAQELLAQRADSARAWISIQECVQEKELIPF